MKNTILNVERRWHIKGEAGEEGNLDVKPCNPTNKA